MAEFKHGDRVYVTDPALAQMREIMRRATGVEPAPNHHGTVEEVWEDGSILIHFDDGMGAPYPANEVRPLTPTPAADESGAPCPGDHAGPCFDGRPDLCREILRADESGAGA